MDRSYIPQVATREQWLAARKALLEQEKALTRQRDALNRARIVRGPCIWRNGFGFVDNPVDFLMFSGKPQKGSKGPALGINLVAIAGQDRRDVIAHLARHILDQRPKQCLF